MRRPKNADNFRLKSLVGSAIDIWYVVLAVILVILAAAYCHGQTPTPTPFSINDAEVDKLSWDDIVATVKHQGRIFKEEHQKVAELQKHLDSATNYAVAAAQDATGGLTHITTLEEGIKTLAEHDAKETARANKLDKALWWYRLHWWGAWIMLGLGILACGAFAVLKATGKISFSAAKVASKLPL